jgi:hypothetical protein
MKISEVGVPSLGRQVEVTLVVVAHCIAPSVSPYRAAMVKLCTSVTFASIVARPQQRDCEVGRHPF